MNLETYSIVASGESCIIFRPIDAGSWGTIGTGLEGGGCGSLTLHFEIFNRSFPKALFIINFWYDLK